MIDLIKHANWVITRCWVILLMSSCGHFSFNHWQHLSASEVPRCWISLGCISIWKATGQSIIITWQYGDEVASAQLHLDHLCLHWMLGRHRIEYRRLPDGCRLRKIRKRDSSSHIAMKSDQSEIRRCPSMDRDWHKPDTRCSPSLLSISHSAVAAAYCSRRMLSYDPFSPLNSLFGLIN